MEKNNTDLPKKSNSSIKWVLAILAVVFLYWGSNVAIAPYYKTKSINQKVSLDKKFNDRFMMINLNQEFNDMVEEISHKEALLQLSQSDSIQLVLDLVDSTLNLSIKGVKIHRVKVTELKVDNLLENLPIKSKIWLMSQPLQIHSQFASIVKEPVVVRHAPKNSEEAAANAYKPDTLIQNPAFASFVLDHNIQLILEQDKIENFQEKKARLMFYKELFIDNAFESIDSLVHIKKQEYQPWIVVKLPTEELRSIYRAMPSKPMLVIRFGE